MKINLNNIRLMMVCTAIILNSLTTSAQKLPNVQVGNMRAPADIKIDGRSTEWDDKFKAYNNATELFYTLANDSNNLYLLVKATDKAVVNKIIKGGLTLTINTSGKKDDKTGVAITFPVFDRTNGFNINLDNKPKKEDGPDAYAVALDSFMRVVNRDLNRTSKEIKTRGMAEVPDNFVSVYNDLGIKAKALVNSDIHYIYELSVPLKYVGLSANTQTKFAYQIRVDPQGPTQLLKSLKEGLTSVKVVAGGGMILEGPTADRVQSLLSATDLWGEYTLAKY